MQNRVTLRLSGRFPKGHQLVQAERNMFAYGRKESMRPYMSQQVNMVIDSINHMMLTIVRHGSHGGLMYVQTA